MIIDCPACNTRFLVHDDQLQPDGRTVRCGRCKNTWFQTYEAPIDDGRSFADVLTQQEALDQPVSNQFPAVKTRPQAAPLWRVAAALATVWVMVLIALFVVPGVITSQWPASARLYSALGMPVAVPGEGLQFSNLATTTGEVNGRTLLVVHGQVDNLGETASPLPNVLITVQDDNRETILSWLHQATLDELAGQTSHAFFDQQWLENEMATRVLIKFTDLE